MFEQRELAFALPWLHGKLQLDNEINLYYLIGNLRQGKHGLYYKQWQKTDKDGSVRPIFEPKGELRVVQKAIQKKILSEFPRHKSSYGFRGGSCIDAVSLHSGSKSLLTFDIRHAFSNVTHYRIFQALYRLNQKPYLSLYVARMVADLCTVGEVISIGGGGCDYQSFGGMLPQGATTSPALFDLSFAPVDNLMRLWAKRLCLRYSRYADNLHFSSAQVEFPDLARAIVVSEVTKMFPVHKIRLMRTDQYCRMLGLNLADGRVTNTRDYKRAFRGALYHLRHALDNSLPYERAWQIANGFMGFAVRETLPAAMLEEYEELKQRIHWLNSLW